MLVEISHGSVSFGAEVILSDINFIIKNKQQNAFEDDSITLEDEIKKGFQKIMDAKTRMDELLECIEKNAAEELVQEYVDLQEQFQNMGGYEYEKEYELIVQKLGFTEEDKQKKLFEFSGGQRTRIAFAKMLLSKLDVLLLDEPTNHMDILSKEALGNMLKNYMGTVLFVSHDRYFIKQVADMLMVFEDGLVKCFSGGYKQYQES